MSDAPTPEILGTRRGKQIVIDPELESLIPPLTADERAQLACSIAERGQIDDVIVGQFMGAGDFDRWTIIDGHNRVRIMLEQEYSLEDIAFRTDLFHDRSEAMLWMLDNQFGRRNLTTNQKLELGYRRAELRRAVAESNRLQNLKQNQADDTESAELHNRESVDVTQDAADYAGVSRRTASKYHTVMEKAAPDVIENLQNNEISIDAAYKRVKGSEPEPEVIDAWPDPDLDRMDRHVQQVVRSAKSLIGDIWKVIKDGRELGSTSIRSIGMMELSLQVDQLRNAIEKFDEIAGTSFQERLSPVSEQIGGEDE